MNRRPKKSRVQFLSRRAADQRARSGSILILALWSVSLLSAFAVILGYEVRQRLTIAHRIDERQKAAYLCDAAVKRAAAQLIKMPQKSYDALNDPWSVNDLEFKDVAFPEGTVSVAYDVADPAAATVTTWYGMQDEQRKVNINKADIVLLQRLFTIVLGCDEIEAQDFAGAILDWRDADSESAIPGSSAEMMYYHGLAHPYEAKNAPFERIEELLLIKGMIPELYLKVKEFLTVYGSGKININTASEAVLLALNIPKDIVEAILTIRRGRDGVDGTLDDTAFDDPSSIVPKVSQSYSLTPNDLSSLSQVVGDYLVTSSEFFTIRCRVQLLNKKSVLGTSCVVGRDGKPLVWGEM